MFEGMIFLASYSSGGIGNFLSEWQSLGVFDYILPFLLLFALIFGLMEKMSLFKNKGIHGVISIVAALMALQFDMVPRFFAEIFPRMGVGLAVILVLLVVAGIFIPLQSKGRSTLFFIIGLVAVIFILSTSFSSLNWFDGGAVWDALGANLGQIILAILIIGGVIAIFNWKPKGGDSGDSAFTLGLHPNKD